MWRGFKAVFLLHAGHGERLARYRFEELLALFLRGELAFGGAEHSVAVGGGENPVRLGLEAFNLFLAVYDEGEGGRLHAPDAQHLAVLAVLQRVEARGVHAEQPVAYGPAQPGEVERLVLGLVFQRAEAFGYGLVGHRRNPQPLHRAACLGLLHHPPLYQFAFLPGVAAVHYAVGGLHQLFYHGELPPDSLVVYELYAKLLRYHWQCAQAPPLPHRRVVVGFFERAEVAERPCHLVAVALHVARAARRCSQYACNVFCHARFFGYADNHFRVMDLECCVFELSRVARLRVVGF